MVRTRLYSCGNQYYLYHLFSFYQEIDAGLLDILQSRAHAQLSVNFCFAGIVWCQNDLDSIVSRRISDVDFRDAPEEK